jgi:hypothetical protein
VVGFLALAAAGAVALFGEELQRAFLARPGAPATRPP